MHPRIKSAHGLALTPIACAFISFAKRVGRNFASCDLANQMLGYAPTVT